MVRERGVFHGSGPRTSSKRRVPCEQTPRSYEDQIFSVGTGSLVERCIVCATGHSRGLSSVQQCISPVNSKGNVLWYSVRNTVELHLSGRWLFG